MFKKWAQFFRRGLAVTDLVDQAEQRSYVGDVPRHRKVLYCADERIARPDVCCCYLKSGELNCVFREVEFLWVLSEAVSSAYIHPFAGLEERFFYCRGPHPTSSMHLVLCGMLATTSSYRRV